ncbi:low-specificity L-threonine aldolase [Candidatus Marinimicrobia bacterium MT.SAG.3]|nr:low-specificity L-threonine aldolase [Candidatus Marinimicrobia bacterium MT.SAG.3]
MIDIRSDTVTKPSDEMRDVISRAEVGDDVFGEDPNVNELQITVAKLFGKESALYVPSGTMANQVSINAHTQPGNEVICETGCHLYNYESGAPALLSGVMLRTIDGEMGSITAEQVESNIRPTSYHFAQTTLITLENTHNRAGGTIFPIGQIKEISEVAKKHNIKMHLDGARLMNAVVATGIEAIEWASYFDSVSICLSKGLGAPVGSVVAGTKAFIERAHRYRKTYGGGMRQAGLLAAAGKYALENNVERLADDHTNARTFAESVASLEGINVELDWVQTNIVMIDIDKSFGSATEWVERLAELDVAILTVSPQRLRAVFHLDVSSEESADAAAKFRDVHAISMKKEGDIE